MIALVLTTHKLLQVLTNHSTEGLCTDGPLTLLIGSHFLVVPAFPCPLSSQELDMGIAIRKVEADDRDNCSKHDRSSSSPTIQGALW
jgi:hypothetical protein